MREQLAPDAHIDLRHQTTEVSHTSANSLIAPETNRRQHADSTRQRTGSFFTNYAIASELNRVAGQSAGIDFKQELTNIGRFKEIALFSRLVNFKDQSGIREKYAHFHPKILELGLQVINEQYNSSNQRCIAMI